MADNVTLDAGTGGAVIATDDDATAHHQYVKVEFGPDNTQTKVTTTEGLPVQNDDTDLKITLDGETVTVAAHAVTNAGTFTVQVDGDALTALQLIDDTVFAEDVAATAADKGIQILAVRRDANTTLVGTDNDYAPLQVDADGKLKVEIFDGGDTLTVGSHAVTNAGTFAVQISDTSFAVADGNALGEGVLVQGDDGTDRKNINVDATTGDVQVDVTNTVTVAAHAVTNAGTFAVQISDTSFAVADGSALGEGVLIQGDDGTDRKNINVDATTGDVQVDVTNTVTVAAHAVTNAGTFVVQVDGDALTSLQLADDTVVVLGTATYTEGTTSGNVIGVVRNDTLAALAGVDNEVAPLQVDANGALYVRIASEASDFMLGTDFSDVLGTATLVTTTQGDALANTLDAVNTTGFMYCFNGTTWDRVREGGDAGSILVDLGANNDVTIAANSTVDVNRIAGTATSVNTGTMDAGTQRVAIASDNDALAVTSTLQTGSALAADVGLSGARTSGGTTLYKNIDVDETEDEIKGTAGQVYWIHAMNLANATRFLKLYNNTAATVVVGTTVPDLTFPLPTQGDTNGAGFTLSIPNGIAFGTAITVAATTGVADNDAGAPGANEVVVNIGYA